MTQKQNTTSTNAYFIILGKGWENVWAVNETQINTMFSSLDKLDSVIFWKRQNVVDFNINKPVDVLLLLAYF